MYFEKQLDNDVFDEDLNFETQVLSNVYCLVINLRQKKNNKVELALYDPKCSLI